MYCPPRQQPFPQANPKKIVAIERSNKLAIVGIARKRYVIMQKKKTLYVGLADFLNGYQT